MDLVNLSLGSGALIALLGYCVVFLGIVMLMLVVLLLCRIMIASTRKEAAKNVPAPIDASAPEPVIAVLAPGSAGELKLYDTDPRDAAMIMAIVADKLGKPLNELRFISIKEVSSSRRRSSTSPTAAGTCPSSSAGAGAVSRSLRSAVRCCGPSTRSPIRPRPRRPGS